MLAAAMLIWGTIGLFRRSIPLTSGQLAFCRGVLGSAFLWVYVRARGGRVFHQTPWKKRALLALSDRKKQLEAAQEVMEKGLSVRETERLIRRLSSPAEAKGVKETRYQDQTAYDELVLSLRRSLGTKVSIRRTEQEKGQLVIEYYSVDELERFADLLKAQR